MLAAAPRSTLFPTRRSSDLDPRGAAQPVRGGGSAPPGRSGARHHRPARGGASQRLRSEEHTSELQSLRHLVCRLLLEKKKAQGGAIALPVTYLAFTEYERSA